MEGVDWTYAISTLLIRFVGIFVVLGILQVVMQITGRIFARLDSAKKTDGSPPLSPSAKGLTEEEAAAVVAALYMHERP